MKNIFEGFKRKKAAALMSVAFLCAIGGIVYTISKYAPDQPNSSSSPSAAASSSVKVKVADISPTSSSASGSASSESPAQKVDIGSSALGNAANYKPETAHPNKERSADKGKTGGSQNSTSAIAIDRITAPDQINLVIGESQAITISIAPENATDKKVIWQSSDPNIATVDKTGMITGVAAGSCTVTVQAAAGKTQACITVTVALQKEVNEGS